jgi:hypothetical protein
MFPPQCNRSRAVTLGKLTECVESSNPFESDGVNSSCGGLTPPSNVR